MRKEEMIRSQGVLPHEFKRVVSWPELGNQIGNSMSQNVIERILYSLLPASGFLNNLKPDRWETGEVVKALKASRDGLFKNQEGPENRTRDEPRVELGEIHG